LHEDRASMGGQFAAPATRSRTVVSLRSGGARPVPSRRLCTPLRPTSATNRRRPDQRRDSGFFEFRGEPGSSLCEPISMGIGVARPHSDPDTQARRGVQPRAVTYRESGCVRATGEAERSCGRRSMQEAGCIVSSHRAGWCRWISFWTIWENPPVVCDIR
jgi:hypothetical protein